MVKLPFNLLVPLLVAALVLVACSGSDPERTSDPAEAYEFGREQGYIPADLSCQQWMQAVADTFRNSGSYDQVRGRFTTDYSEALVDEVVARVENQQGCE